MTPRTPALRPTVRPPSATCFVVAALFLAACAGPGTAQAAIEVSERRAGERIACPPLDDGAGGCELEARAEDVGLVFLSVLGPIAYGECYFDFTLRVDAAGRTMVTDVFIYGRSSCADTEACRDGPASSGIPEPEPWRGHLDELVDGRLLHRGTACFDTCLGRFQGRFEIELRPTAGRGWRAVASRVWVGTSGWRVDGQWTLKERDIDFGQATVE